MPVRCFMWLTWLTWLVCARVASLPRTSRVCVLFVYCGGCSGMARSAAFCARVGIVAKKRKEMGAVSGDNGTGRSEMWWTFRLVAPTATDANCNKQLFDDARWTMAAEKISKMSKMSDIYLSASQSLHLPHNIQGTLLV